MNKKQVAKNSGVPISIYKNGELLKQCISIQEAGRFLREFSCDTKFRFARIENGYCYGDNWSFNGATYNFKTDENIRISRKNELEQRNAR